MLNRCILLCILVIFCSIINFSLQQDPAAAPGIPPLPFTPITSFNLMNCMDFARHMTSTANQFGFIANPPARRQLINDPIMKLFQTRQADLAAATGTASAAAVAAASPGGFLDGLQGLFTQVLNVGDSNVIACNQRPQLAICNRIDEYLNDYLPQWWFNLKVTDNANYVIGQLTSSRFHSLAEVGLKAYKCFCQC